MEGLTLTSSAFKNGELIPPKYTCDGENTNPPLVIPGVGEDVQSLVLIMDDPDVPKAVRDDQMFDHWVLFNISPPPPGGTKEIKEGDIPGTLGSNTTGEAVYIGPCPPTQFEPKEHRYIFQLYALDTTLDIREGASKEVVKSAMKGHILQKAELMGRYARMESK